MMSTTKRDTMDMAREADIDWHRHWNDDESNRLKVFEDLVRADERKQALAAPTVQEPVAWPMEEQPDGSIIPVDPTELPSDYFTTTPPAQPAPDLSRFKTENQKQIREWLADGSFTQRAIDTMFALSEQITVLKKAQPAPVQEPVAITEQMAFAFHNAITDGAIGTDDLMDIMRGLEAAFAHITTPPAAQPAPVQELAQVTIPEGMVLVPYEPSVEMQEQGSTAAGYDLSQKRARYVYQSMIDMHVLREGAEPTDQWFRIQAGYTTPPAAQRQWVGLTDEEINLEIHNTDDGDWNDLRFRDCWQRGFEQGAKWADQKLEEKNSD